MSRAAFALLLVLVLAGCGGGDALSREEYAEEFRQARSQLNAIEERFRTPTNPESQLQVLRTTETQLRDVADELDALEPPEELADEHRQLVEAVRNQADSVAEVTETFERGGNLEDVAPAANEAVQRLVEAIDAVEAELSSG